MPNINTSWVAGEEIDPRLIVKQDPSSNRQILKATLGDMPVGVVHEGTVYAPIPEVSDNPAVLSGDSVRVYGPDEECEVDVDENLAITAGDMVAPNANSKAQPSVHGFPVIGKAIADAEADGKVRVRVCTPYREDKSNTLLVKTDDYTVTLADLGKVLTNTGASGNVTFTLPAAKVGYEVIVRVDAAEQLRLDPQDDEQICLPSTGVPGTAGNYIVADAVNEGVHLKCREAGIWDCLSYTGTWTSE